VFSQAQSIGLVQGLFVFSQQFAPNEQCQLLSTKKHKLAFLTPEPDFFIVLMVSNPLYTLQGEVCCRTCEREREGGERERESNCIVKYFRSLSLTNVPGQGNVRPKSGNCNQMCFSALYNTSMKHSICYSGKCNKF